MARVTETSSGLPSLVELCLQVSVEHDYWRAQRRQLECLPEEAANELLRRLLRQRRLSAPQLALFRHSATVVTLAYPSGAWLAELGAFSALRELRLARCDRLRDAHLAPLAAAAPTLHALDLSGCSGVSPAALAAHLAPLSALRRLDVSGTALGSPGLACLAAALTGLTALLAACPALDDACCEAVGASLPALRELSLAGSGVGDGGAQHLEGLGALTGLDLSHTRARCPPVLPSLRRLCMEGCTLGLEDETAQEAVWLHLGAALPCLEELRLAGASLAPPHGERLLQRLLAGSAASLGRLDLRGVQIGGGLAALEAAGRLTWLDLSGTPATDRDLCPLALLPLRWLSLAGTAVGDAGLAQLLAATALSRLDLRDTRVGDAAWPVLAQLPQLAWLDASGSRAAFSAAPEGHSQPALTSLTLSPASKLDHRGCRNLAAAAPLLRELRLGGRAVDDRALRALCSGLRQLESLSLSLCSVTDPGLLSALPRCAASLRQLSLRDCWLASAAGLQAAAAAAVRAGGGLESVEWEGAAVPLPQPAAVPAGPRRSASGADSALPAAPAARPRPAASAGVLPAAVLEYDERLAYSAEELLGLEAAGRPRGSPAAQRLRQLLPPDLCAP